MMKKLLIIMVFLFVNSFGSQAESKSAAEEVSVIDLAKCGLCKKNFIASDKQVFFACNTTNGAHLACYNLIKDADAIFSLVSDRPELHQVVMERIEEHVLPAFKVNSILELRAKIGNAGIKSLFTSALLKENELREAEELQKRLSKKRDSLHTKASKL